MSAMAISLHLRKRATVSATLMSVTIGSDPGPGTFTVLVIVTLHPCGM